MADAFDLPVIEDIAGEKVTFSKIELDDYALWMAEIESQRKVRDKAIMVEAGVADPGQKFDILRIIANSGANLGDIQSAVHTPKGAQRVLRMSIAKAAGVSLLAPLDKTAYDNANAGTRERLKKIPVYRLMELAREVSCLFRMPVLPGPTKQADKNPESQSPESGEDSSTETGSESDTSSGM